MQKFRRLLTASLAHGTRATRKRLFGSSIPTRYGLGLPIPTHTTPFTGVMPLGRFNAERWKTSWNELFRSHTLLHNIRDTRHIAVSEQLDGAFAVVDVDTLWRHNHNGTSSHWLGRACKVYTKVNGGWLFIHQTGLLSYPQ